MANSVSEVQVGKIAKKVQRKRKGALAELAKPVEQVKEFNTLQEAFDLIDALARKKVTGYLSVKTWKVEWKA